MWAIRGVAALGALLVLLGVSVAVASGPIAQEATPIAQVEVVASPSPTAQLPLPSTSPTPLAAPTFVPVEERPRALFLGDSITRGMTEPSSGQVGDYSWFFGLVDDSSGVLRYGGTIAENGMMTSWMVGQAYEAVALQPDLLVVHGGTNDISGEVEPAAVIANLQQIKDIADAAGVPLAVCTLPPRSDPEADARAVAVNAVLVVWAAEQGVILLDTAAPLRDPLGGWREGLTTDGLHPTPEAVLLMSQAAAAALRAVPPGV